MEKWTRNDIPDLTGKIVVITGANTGLGFQSAKEVVAKNGTLIMACRSLERAKDAKNQILAEYPNGSIETMQLDLSDLSTIKQFSEQFMDKYSKLDVLMNNAGVMATPKMKTKDGFEFQSGINHLGHYALVGYLLPILKNTPAARVVVVSSIAHKGAVVDTTDYFFEKRKYQPFTAYRQSKLSNLLFTYELDRKLKEHSLDIKVIAAHPGVSRTDLPRFMLKGFLKVLLYPIFYLITQSVEIGALPQLRAAFDPFAKSGEYYGPNGRGEKKGYPIIVEALSNAHDEENAKKLWELSETLTKVTYRF